MHHILAAYNPHVHYLHHYGSPLEKLMQVELMQGKSVGLGKGGYLVRLLVLAFKGYSPYLTNDKRPMIVKR